MLGNIVKSHKFPFVVGASNDRARNKETQLGIIYWQDQTHLRSKNVVVVFSLTTLDQSAILD